MEITILSIGRISLDWIQKGLELFESRIGRYIKFSVQVLPDIRNAKSLSVEQIKTEEGKNLLAQINPTDYVVLLDEKGREFTSRGFAEWIQKQMNSGRKRLLLIIGGPYGFSEAVYERADTKIALSSMTFTHEMAKLLLTEQIYRAMTILRREPYHHD
ncbi:MAG: 23S rRNA (pseudouridine(1915)-N(3))-methyltransferase RlmH [Muribaculaceae bacterium]|nr:23S rRNA (pseudouridine(1915)-N(3))-methyltransferase RlmH [Muribaculaceae bacterium]